MTPAAPLFSSDSALLDAFGRTVAPPADPARSPGRLISLDVFRGLVIFAMLIVNNLGDARTTGYFWKHADWPEPWLAESFRLWWATLAGWGKQGPPVVNELRRLYWGVTQFPVFRQCTLADYVMPSFMLIIGLAISYSVT